MTFDPVKIALSMGVDETPTREQVARGAHGNGVWDKLTPDELNELAAQSRAKGRNRREKLIQAHDDELVKQLAGSALLHKQLIDEGNRILKECADDERSPTPIEMDLVKRAQKAAEVVPDRVIGKSSQRHEITGQVDLVSMISGQGDVNDFDDDPIDVDWEEDASDVEPADPRDEPLLLEAVLDEDDE